MNTIEIKTDLSGEELQVLIWEIEAFCEKAMETYAQQLRRETVADL